jgi:hypothetical protein
MGNVRYLAQYVTIAISVTVVFIKEYCKSLMVAMGTQQLANLSRVKDGALATSVICNSLRPLKLLSGSFSGTTDHGIRHAAGAPAYLACEL